MSWAAVLCAVVVAGCGGDDGLSLNDYAARVQTAVVAMNAKIDAGEAHYFDRPAQTLEDAQRRWTERVAWREELLEVLTSLEPPAEAADLHDTAVEVISELAQAEQAIADRTLVATSFEEIADLEEGELERVRRAVDNRAVAVCRAAEEALDREYDPGLVSSTPWVPVELQEMVDVAFGCTVEDRRG